MGKHVNWSRYRLKNYHCKNREQPWPNISVSLAPLSGKEWWGILTLNWYWIWWGLQLNHYPSAMSSMRRNDASRTNNSVPQHCLGRDQAFCGTYWHAGVAQSDSHCVCSCVTFKPINTNKLSLRNVLHCWEEHCRMLLQSWTTEKLIKRGCPWIMLRR